MVTFPHALNDSNLNEWRHSIDLLDSSLMFLLAERARLIKRVGLVKKHHNIPFSYSKTRQKDLEKIFDMVAKANIAQDFIKCFYDRIYEEAISLIESLSDSVTLEEKDENPYADLLDLQNSFHNIDISICHILIERFHIVKKIAIYKKNQHIPPLSAERFQALLLKKIQMANQLNINPIFIEDIFKMIHEHSLALQK